MVCSRTGRAEGEARRRRGRRASWLGGWDVTMARGVNKTGGIVGGSSKQSRRQAAGIAGLALVLASASARAEPARGLGEVEKAELARALACVNLSPAALGWDKRPINDPFRLAVVNRALDEPLSLADMAEAAEADFGTDLATAARAVATWLAPASGVVSGNASPFPRIEEIVRGAPPAISRVVGVAREARGRVALAIPESARATLQRDAPRLYLDESEEAWDSTAVREAARQLKVEHLVASFRAMASLATSARDWTPETLGAPRAWTIAGMSVIVGTPGPDRHANADIVLDPGGDDIYERVAFIVDLAGNDTYTDCGSGRLAAGLIVDLAGNDRYLGQDITQGGAVGGAALLLDVAGDDRYEASQLAQGAGVLGIGMLIDLAGNDAYRGARFVQGFGGVGGLGVLSDLAGNDTYWAGGVFSHAPLLPENYQSLSQGFGFGLRPDASGGVGVLVDRAGNDAYHAEVYGQGASYWFALGVLVDSAGHDKYDLYQYGQGAGIHLSAGVLLDRKGNDGYSCNNGVAQGSGHDWAVGLLWDQAGNDAYQGSGMSQGGANANGIGMIVDRAGNDSYAGWGDRNQGDSFPARGSVGLGVLLDLQGRDRYTHGGADGATWTRGSLGVGRDVPDPPPPVAGGAP